MSTNQLYGFWEGLQQNRHRLFVGSWVTFSVQHATCPKVQRSEWKVQQKWIQTARSSRSFVQLLPEMDSYKRCWSSHFRIQSQPMTPSKYTFPGDSTTFIHDFGVGFSYCWTYTYHQLFYHRFSVSWLVDPQVGVWLLTTWVWSGRFSRLSM